VDKSVAMVTMSTMGEKPYVRHLFARYDGLESFSATPDDAAIVELAAHVQAVALKIDRGPSAVSYKFGLSDRIVDGRLAATACCSDLLAAWSRPRALMLSATVPPETRVADLDAALDGFVEICSGNDVEFVGGDTKAGPWSLVACGLGELHRGGGFPAARQTGDRIFVCGGVGSFTAATLWAMGKTDAISRNDAVHTLCYPQARWREAAWLRSIVIPTACTDASDGLFEALLNVASPGSGVRIYERQLPFTGLARAVSAATAIPLSSFLYGGGDWNLVLTVPQKQAELLDSSSRPKDLDIVEVGEITDCPGFQVSFPDGTIRFLQGMVSDHFLGRIEDAGEYFEQLKTYDGWAANGP
jgi:thiamine-monophosphate kinase